LALHVLNVATNIMKIISKSSLLGIVALAATTFSSQAYLAPLPSNPNTWAIGGSIIVAADGNVEARFEGETAGYDNYLYLAVPGTYGPGNVIFFNHGAIPGVSTVDLGYYTAGTELIFRLYVANTGDNWYSGPAFRNYDGLGHAAVTTVGGRTWVGFEDLYGGGDRDYDDTVFSFDNTRSTSSVPEGSATLPLLGFGLSALGLMGWRLRK
jgi:hypothetical protein